MTHMDAYTILYQAEEHMVETNCIEKLIQEAQGEENLAEIIQKIALAELEQGIQLIRWEYPPNVSKRMQKYYQQNKETLIECFSHKVREVMTHYRNGIIIEKN